MTMNLSTLLKQKLLSNKVAAKEDINSLVESFTYNINKIRIEAGINTRFLLIQTDNHFYKAKVSVEYYSINYTIEIERLEEHEYIFYSETILGLSNRKN